MTFRDNQKLNLKTNAARDKAEVLLRQLIETKQQAADQHERSLRRLTGQTPDSPAPSDAIDKAIETTRHFIEQLNEQMSDDDAPPQKHAG